jgi:hypothetical protein
MLYWPAVATQRLETVAGRPREVVQPRRAVQQDELAHRRPLHEWADPPNRLAPPDRLGVAIRKAQYHVAILSLHNTKRKSRAAAP